MANICIDYTITVQSSDGHSLSFNKEQILTAQDTSNLEHVQKILEREFRETEQQIFLTELKNQHGKEFTTVSFKITKTTTLKPAGDDDQM